MLKTLAAGIIIAGYAVGAAQAAAPKVAGADLEISPAQQDMLIQARITKTNRGGNEPSGEARGIPARNPAGKAPPGHNK